MVDDFDWSQYESAFDRYDTWCSENGVENELKQKSVLEQLEDDAMNMFKEDRQAREDWAGPKAAPWVWEK